MNRPSSLRRVATIHEVDEQLHVFGQLVHDMCELFGASRIRLAPADLTGEDYTIFVETDLRPGETSVAAPPSPLLLVGLDGAVNGQPGEFSVVDLADRRDQIPPAAETTVTPAHREENDAVSEPAPGDDLVDPGAGGMLDLAELRAADVAAGAQQCRSCGCTDNVACSEGCSWAEPGLCSQCVDVDEGAGILGLDAALLDPDNDVEARLDLTPPPSAHGLAVGEMAPTADPECPPVHELVLAYLKVQPATQGALWVHLDAETPVDIGGGELGVLLEGLWADGKVDFNGEAWRLVNDEDLDETKEPTAAVPEAQPDPPASNVVEMHSTKKRRGRKPKFSDEEIVEWLAEHGPASFTALCTGLGVSATDSMRNRLKVLHSRDLVAGSNSEWAARAAGPKAAPRKALDPLQSAIVEVLETFGPEHPKGMSSAKVHGLLPAAIANSNSQGETTRLLAELVKADLVDQVTFGHYLPAASLTAS